MTRNEKTEELEITENLEIMAEAIFDRIERAKNVFKKFEWDGDNRDFLFYQFKQEIDSIWSEIKRYRGECLEESMLYSLRKMRVASIKARPKQPVDTHGR